MQRSPGNIGALIIRIGFLGYIILQFLVRNPPKPYSNQGAWETANPPARNIGAFIVRIRSWDPLYYNYYEEPPQHGICNHLGSYFRRPVLQDSQGTAFRVERASVCNVPSLLKPQGWQFREDTSK